MLFPRSIILGVLSLAAQVIAKSSTGDKVLVVLESGIEKSDYSSFWASLEGGYSILDNVQYMLTRRARI
jgi:oligosaccharyltransferase complex subunit beta